MKARLEALLNEVISTTEFQQAWLKDHPEQFDDSRRMRLHFLDGKREVIEILLKEFYPVAPIVDLQLIGFHKFPLRRKRRLPILRPNAPQRYAVEVALEERVVGSVIHVSIVDELGKQYTETWLVADAPKWARERVREGA